MKISRFVWQTTTTYRNKKRAARAAWLFFLIQPIKSLICGVVVDVASSNPKLPHVKTCTKKGAARAA